MIKGFHQVDKKSWEATQDVTFMYGDSNAHIEVFIESGFITDFATIPFPLSLIFPKEALYALPAAVHDKLYESKKLSKIASDSIFYQAMKEAGVRGFTRSSFYIIVLLFGWLKWKK